MTTQEEKNAILQYLGNRWLLTSDNAFRRSVCFIKMKKRKKIKKHMNIGITVDQSSHGVSDLPSARMKCVLGERERNSISCKSILI